MLRSSRIRSHWQLAASVPANGLCCFGWCLVVLCVWFVLLGAALRCLVGIDHVPWCSALLGGVWWCWVVLSGAFWCFLVLGGAWWCWWCLVVLVVLGGA